MRPPTSAKSDSRRSLGAGTSLPAQKFVGACYRSMGPRSAPRRNALEEERGGCGCPCLRSGWSERHWQPLDAADEVRAQLLRLGRGLDVRQSAEQLDKHRGDLA